MHDLNVINRLNAESSAASAIRATTAGGRAALARYEGLHLMDQVGAGTKEAMDGMAAELSKSAAPGTHYKVIAPTH